MLLAALPDNPSDLCFPSSIAINTTRTAVRLGMTTVTITMLQSGSDSKSFKTMMMFRSRNPASTILFSTRTRRTSYPRSIRQVTATLTGNKAMAISIPPTPMASVLISRPSSTLAISTTPQAPTTNMIRMMMTNARLQRRLRHLRAECLSLMQSYP